MNVEIKTIGKSANGVDIAELWVNGARVATGTIDSIRSQATRYGSAPTPSPSTSTSSVSPQSYTPPASTQKQPIPDSIYTELRNALVNGQTTVRQALDSLQKLIDTKTFSGSIDQNRILQPITVTTSQGTYTISPATALDQRFDSGSIDLLLKRGNISGISISAAGGSTPGTSPTATNPAVPNVPVPKFDEAAAALLNNPALTADQKDALTKLFSTLSVGDTAAANKMVAAFNAATAYSDPYFKAQVSILSDALSRGLAANEGDLAHSERVLNQTLSDLRANTAASHDQLSFQHLQELSKLARSYETDLGTVRDNMAAVGKSSSSVRSRAEQLLNESNTGLVESANRNYSYQSGTLSRDLASKGTSTTEQIAYLQDKATQARIDALRKTEEQVGSSTLGALGYSGGDVLGGVSGEIPRKKVVDALSAATSWVF